MSRRVCILAFVFLALGFGIDSIAADGDEFRAQISAKTVFDSAQKKSYGSTTIGSSLKHGFEKRFGIEDYWLSVLITRVGSDSIEIDLRFLNEHEVVLVANSIQVTLNAESEFSLTSDEIAVEGTIKISTNRQ